MIILKQGQSTYHLVFMMIDSADHMTPKTGLFPTVTLSKNGAAFGAASGAVAEVTGGSNGWYKVAGNATDTNTLGSLVLHATAAGADPTDAVFWVAVSDTDTIDTVVDAIKAKSDYLPSATAGAAGGVALVGSNMGSASSVSGAVGSVTSGVTVTTNNDKTGYELTVTPPAASAIADAVWNETALDHVTAGSIGALIHEVARRLGGKLVIDRDANTINVYDESDVLIYTQTMTTVGAVDTLTRS